jgi:hypothetical protein
MIKKSVSRETNEENLRYFTNLLSSCEHFVFFGTLLGLVRDNRIINGDDDVDIYVNSAERDIIIDIFKKENIKFDLDEYPNNTPHILQIKRLVKDEVGLVDFYFYKTDIDPNNIWEMWNFFGIIDPTSALKIPRNFIFPLKPIYFQGVQIFLPAKARKICAYLYGKNWNKPLVKNREYITKIINNKPRVFYHGKIGKIQLRVIKILDRLGILKVG